MQVQHFYLFLAYLINLSFCFKSNVIASPLIRSIAIPYQELNISRAELQRRQSTGVCGPTNNNAVCDQNQCCSEFGYCGTGDIYCSAITNCQPDYGRCGNQPLTTSSTSAAPPTTSTSSTSTTPIVSSPPPSSTSTTSTSSSSVVSVSSTSSSSIPPLPSGTLTPSINGMCGNSTTCTGTGFGSCCSQFYYCGNSMDYCGAGCNPLFGSCGSVSSSSSSSSTIPTSTSSTSIYTPPPPTSTSSTSIYTPPPPTSTSSTPTGPTPGPGLTSSTDGTCGNTFSCAGSTFGNCCSRWGYCGNDSIYCSLLIGCQPQFGTCTGTASS